MPLGQGETVVDVQGINGHAVGQRSAWRRDRPSIHPQLGPNTGICRGAKIVDYLGEPGLPPTNSSAQSIEQAAPRLALNRERQIVPISFVNEFRYPQRCFGTLQCVLVEGFWF